GLPDDEGSAYLVVDGRVHSDGPWNVSGILSARGRLVDSHRSGWRPAKATRGVGARRYIFGNARPAAGSYDGRTDGSRAADRVQTLGTRRCRLRQLAGVRLKLKPA